MKMDHGNECAEMCKKFGDCVRNRGDRGVGSGM